MCYVKANGSTGDPDSNIIYGSNSKGTITSLTRLNLHPITYVGSLSSPYVHDARSQEPKTYIQLQNSVILGTCSIVRNFLNYK